MRFFKAVKDFICYGSVYFTAIASVMLIIASGKTSKVPDTERFLLFLLLSFIFALGSVLYRLERINRPLAATLHATIYNVGFLIFLVLCGMDFSKSVIGTVIFAVCYTVITVVYRLIEKKIRKANAKKASEPVSPSVTTDNGGKRSPAPKKGKKEENGGYTNLFS